MIMKKIIYIGERHLPPMMNIYSNNRNYLADNQL